MKKWDKYFYSHYKPKRNDWGYLDMMHYKKWYFAWLNFIEKKIKLKKNAKVLEVGSGIGGVVSLLVDKNFKVTGSDISKKMVKIGNKLNKNASFIYCDISKHIYGKYDAIFAFEVLEHIKNPETAIGNIKKSLRKGGYFIGSSPYPFKKAYSDPTHCSVNYPHVWEYMFIKAGYKKITVYPISIIPFIWRINSKLNIILPFYVPFKHFVSTSLIIAKK